MAELAGRIVFDVDEGTVEVDGKPFPWAVADAGVTLVDVHGDGKTLLPAVELKLVAGALEVVSASVGGEVRGPRPR